MKSSRRSGGNTRFIVHSLSFPIYLGMLSFRLPHSLVSIIFCNAKNLPVNLCNLKVIYYDSRTSLPCKKWGVEWIDTKLCALMLDNSSITYISEHGYVKKISVMHKYSLMVIFLLENHFFLWESIIKFLV